MTCYFGRGVWKGRYEFNNTLGSDLLWIVSSFARHLFYFLNLRTRFHTCARIHVTVKATNRSVDRAHSVKGCPIWLPTPRLSGHARARMHMRSKFPCTFLDWFKFYHDSHVSPQC